MLRRGVAGAGGRHGRRPARVAIARILVIGLVGIGTLIAVASPAAADASDVGDLTGNFSPVTYLLIPLALVLAFLTALALGPSGDPGASSHRAGGLERALSGRDAPSDRRPS